MKFQSFNFDLKFLWNWSFFHYEKIIRFKESPQLPGAGRPRAWHYHGSGTTTSPRAILLHSYYNPCQTYVLNLMTDLYCQTIQIVFYFYHVLWKSAPWNSTFEGTFIMHFTMVLSFFIKEWISDHQYILLFVNIFLISP